MQLYQTKGKPCPEHYTWDFWTGGVLETSNKNNQSWGDVCK